jgi:hypothetical protein
MIPFALAESSQASAVLQVQVVPRTSKILSTSRLALPAMARSDAFARMEVGEGQAAPLIVRTQRDMERIGEGERRLVPIIATILQNIVARNDSLGVDVVVTHFHAQRAPMVEIVDYCERIVRYSQCSPCCFVVALIYIDRLLALEPTFFPSSLNIHRLTLTSVLLASKFLDDFYYNNAYWARVGGVGTGELNTLELDMLAKLHFNLHVQTEEYLQYRDELLLQHTSDAPVSAEELEASRCAPYLPCCFFAHCFYLFQGGDCTNLLRPMVSGRSSPRPSSTCSVASSHFAHPAVPCVGGSLPC